MLNKDDNRYFSFFYTFGDTIIRIQNIWLGRSKEKPDQGLLCKHQLYGDKYYKNYCCLETKVLPASATIPLIGCSDRQVADFCGILVLTL